MILRIEKQFENSSHLTKPIQTKSTPFEVLSNLRGEYRINALFRKTQYCKCKGHDLGPGHLKHKSRSNTFGGFP